MSSLHFRTLGLGICAARYVFYRRHGKLAYELTLHGFLGTGYVVTHSFLLRTSIHDLVLFLSTK